MTTNKRLGGIFGMAAAAMIAVPLVFAATAQAQEDSRSSELAPAAAAVSDSAAVSAAPGGDVSYLYPLALLGLLTIPGLWWLRKVTPPAPRDVEFPAARIFDKVENREDTPAKTPLWQLLLLTTMASALIVGMSDPVVDPAPPLGGEGPLLIVVDNGWDAAPQWDRRSAEVMGLIDRAAREERPVVLMMTAGNGDGRPVSMTGAISAADARDIARSMAPQPWPSDRQEAARLLAADGTPATAVWISSGIDSPGAVSIAETLARQDNVRVIADEVNAAALLLVPPEDNAADLAFTVRRASADGMPAFALIARAEDGRLLSRIDATFEEGSLEAQAVFELPGEVRNELAIVSIEGQDSAGAVVLMDERWRRRPVGLIGAGEAEAGNPLLSERYFLREALSPYVDLREGSTEDLLSRNLALMVMTDDAIVGAEDSQRIDDWVRRGGTLLRFAGPRLAASPEDDLLPVPLRVGERELGGDMSWSEPARLAPFAAGSPFQGIGIPEDVTVSRQVLAQPGLSVREKTWASLADGTPLITAEQRGDGLVILVHTTAGPGWSNLALSGVYIDLLRAVVARSQGVSGLDPDAVLPPLRTLDGFGRLGLPPAATLPIAGQALIDANVTAVHPPGFYGDRVGRQAHNIGAIKTDFAPMPEMPEGVIVQNFKENREVPLKGALLYGALALLIADLLVVMSQRGMLPGQGGGTPNPGPNPLPNNAQALATRRHGPGAGI